MTPYPLVGLCTLVLLLLAKSVLAEDFTENWTLVKSDDELNIQVFTQPVPNSPYKAFRGITEVNSNLFGAVALLGDPDSFPNWMHNMLSYKVLKRNGAETISHSLTKSGPFVDDRDSIIRSVLVQDQNTKAVTISLNSLPDFVPHQEESVRVLITDGYWKFTPLSADKVRVVYQLHVDPGGSIPDMLVNAFVVDNPYETLKGMHKELPKYQGHVLSYITMDN